MSDIGMSTRLLSFRSSLLLADADARKNLKLLMIDAASGRVLSIPLSDYWKHVDCQLQRSRFPLQATYMA